MRTVRVATIAALLAAAGFWVTLPGCAGAKARRLARQEAQAERQRREALAGAPDLTQPPVIAADAGLEATWLISSAEPGRLATALTPYLDADIPAPTGAVDLWEANGLRLVRVPLQDWVRLAGDLSVAGAAQRQWLAQGAVWTEIAAGPERPGGQVIALDAERLELAPGRLRLLGRCWLAPIPGSANGEPAAAELIVELLPQLREPVREGLAGFGAPKVESAIDQGLTFDRLGLRMRVRAEPEEGRSAYVLIAERPGIDWMNPPVPAREREAHPERAAGLGEVVRHPAGAGGTGSWMASSADRGDAGPSAPPLPTLGEAMLASTGLAAGLDEDAPPPARLRPVLVLIPHVPETFQLLPGSQRRAESDRPARRPARSPG